MDGALGLHHHFDLFVGHGEQMVRLDHLQPLVHEGGGIDGDLAAHVPGRVRKRLRRRDALQVGALLAAERAAGSGYPQLGDLAGLFAQKALVDGTVLGVDGHKAAGLCSHGHDKVAAHHQRFLVGKGKHLARLQRFVAGLQAGSSHQGIHDHVHLGKVNQLAHRVGAETDGARPTEAGHMLLELGNRRRPCRIGGAQRDMTHAKFLGLRQQVGTARARSQRHCFQAVGMAAHHIERLRADGAGRPQNGDAALRCGCGAGGFTVTRHRVCTLLR